VDVPQRVSAAVRVKSAEEKVEGPTVKLQGLGSARAVPQTIASGLPILANESHHRGRQQATICGIHPRTGLPPEFRQEPSRPAQRPEVRLPSRLAGLVPHGNTPDGPTEPFGVSHILDENRRPPTAAMY
jgi:hypothetical protein